MATRMRARTAPNEQEQQMLLHVVRAQRELERALRLSNSARRDESFYQRRRAYRRIHRDLLAAANHLNRIQGTHHISTPPEAEPESPVDAFSELANGVTDG